MAPFPLRTREETPIALDKTRTRDLAQEGKTSIPLDQRPAYVQQLESSTIKLTHLERELKQAHEQVRRNHHTVVTLQTLRPTLLYDTVCTITDMHFAAYHGVVHIGEVWEQNRVLAGFGIGGKIGKGLNDNIMKSLFGCDSGATRKKDGRKPAMVAKESPVALISQSFTDADVRGSPNTNKKHNVSVAVTKPSPRVRSSAPPNSVPQDGILDGKGIFSSIIAKFSNKLSYRRGYSLDLYLCVPIKNVVVDKTSLDLYLCVPIKNVVVDKTSYDLKLCRDGKMKCYLATCLIKLYSRHTMLEDLTIRLIKEKVISDEMNVKETSEILLKRLNDLEHHTFVDAVNENRQWHGSSCHGSGQRINLAAEGVDTARRNSSIHGV
ncbi:hypothetical protein Tco_1175146 [Tanacetum coccineum]